MKTLLSFVLFSFISLQTAFTQIYKDSTASTNERVEDLLQRMTLAEKIGQMTQGERGSLINNNHVTTYFLGSVLSGGGSAPSDNSPQGWADMYDAFQSQAMATRLAIPIIYGTDAVHGNNNLFGATIFPHNIGLGCTRDTNLVQQAARITAVEVAATGVDWTFSPCVAVPRDERWGRTYEGFSEDPELVSRMSAAAVKGYQGDSLKGPFSILACAKHYAGDGGTTRGINIGNTEVDEATLRAIHLPGYVSAVNNQVATVMTSYSSWNGTPMHRHDYLINDVLKGELGFQGFVVSDWNGIGRMQGGTLKSKIRAAVHAGIDMGMEPATYRYFCDSLTWLVNNDEVTMERIDDAVRRILRVKFEMGLFEQPYANRTLFDSVRTGYHLSVARECVRKSLVVLKKRDDVLPLAKTGMQIHVAGSNADDIGNQCGGWTLFWQGFSGNFIPGTSIYTGFTEVAGGNTYTYSENASGGEGAGAGIVVIGERPYAETNGDLGSIDYVLTTADIRAVRTMKEYGIPVIVILVTGRPVNIQPIYHYADVIIAAWLPGTEGAGIADVIFGDHNPVGLLSYTWPESNSRLPENTGDEGYRPFYAYGYGITTLENAHADSAPEFYSAAVSRDGGYLELSFSKQMADPAGTLDNFLVEVDGYEHPLSAAASVTGDPFRVRLYTGEGRIIRNGMQVVLNYVPGSLTALDGSAAGEIIDYPVYNYSEQVLDAKPEIHTGNEITIYPNPADEELIIQAGGEDDFTRAELINTAGSTVASYERLHDGMLRVKTSHLPAGVYLIKISSNMKTLIRKIEIVH